MDLRAPAGPEGAAGVRRRPAALAAVAYAGGLVVAALLNLPPLPFAIIALALAAAGAVFYRRAFATWLLLGALACGGIGWYGARRDYLGRGDVLFGLDPRLAPTAATLTGVVADDPERRPTGTAFILKLNGREEKGVLRPARGRVRVSSFRPVDVRYGDRIRVTGALGAVRPARNPGGFDYRAYLWRRGVTAQMRISRPEAIRLLAHGKGNLLVAGAFAVKHRAAAVIARSVGGDEGRLLNALTLGTREDLDPAVTADFQAAGVAHLLAVSGFNVGILAFILFLVLEGTRLPRAAVTLIVMAFLPAFAIMTGFNPPVVRATVLGLLVLTARLFRFDTDLFNLLGAAALILLVENPLMIADASFLLSFVATLGLAAFYPVFERWFARWPALIRETAAATLAAQLAVLPLQMYWFFRFSPAALLSNLIMVPLTSLATALALVTIVAGVVWPALGDLYGGAAWLGAKALLICGHYFARGLAPLVEFWPALARVPILGPRWDFQFWWGRPAVPFVAALLVFAMRFLVKGRYGRLVMTAAAAALALGGGLALAKAEWERRDRLEVVFLDVGQADAAAAVFPNGKVMVVDAGFALPGLYDAGESTVAPYLRSRGRNRIDYLCITHGDADHAGGAAWLVENMDVGEVWLPAEGGRGTALSRLKTACETRRVPYRAAPPALSSGGVAVARLWPPAPEPPFSANDLSTVLRLTFGKGVVLFTGDLDRRGEEGLLAAGALLRADVLKVPHHGAEAGAYPPFIAAVNPRLAVVNTRAGSRKHPAPATLALYEHLGTATLATHNNGAARVETDGRRLRVVTRY